MSLAGEGVVHRLVLECPVLRLNVFVNLVLLVVLEPILLALHLLLQQHVVLSVMVDVFHQVDLGLILSSPLLLTSLPDFVALFVN